MRRRAFLTLLGGAAAWPLAARAQQSERIRRIGVLTVFAERDLEAKAWLTAFQDGLQQLGWMQGRNLSIDYRWADDDPDRLRTYAAELVRMAPDVLFAAANRRWRRCVSKLARCRSCSCRFPIRSSSASSRASRGRAATSPGLPISNTPSAANGSN